MTTEAALAEAAPVAPSRATFEDVYRREFPALTAYCMRVTGDEQAAHDIAQEALVRLFSRLGRVEQPRAWLYAVATNLIRTGWARQQRDRGVLRLLRAGWQPSEPGPDTSLRDAVQRLPARLRDVVLLHYFADLPVHDIGIATGLAVGTVKRRLHEARKQLALTLGENA